MKDKDTYIQLQTRGITERTRKINIWDDAQRSPSQQEIRAPRQPLLPRMRVLDVSKPSLRL